MRVPQSHNDIYHHNHRRATMMTSDDNGNEGRQDDERRDINDIPSEHPGTETSEAPFHRNLLFYTIFCDVGPILGQIGPIVGNALGHLMKVFLG